MNNYIIYCADVETSSLCPYTGDIIELSLFRLTDGIQKTWLLKVKNEAGIDPLNKLHNTYSTDGSPDVKWRTISGEGMKPQPSRLDFAEGKDKYNAKNKYTGK